MKSNKKYQDMDDGEKLEFIKARIDLLQSEIDREHIDWKRDLLIEERVRFENLFNKINGY